MGLTLDAESYIPCVRCNVWVPNYAKEIHAAECHELKLLSFSHPYITGSSMFVQALTIGTLQTLQNESNVKNSEAKEAEGMKKKKKNTEKSNAEGFRNKDKQNSKESSVVGQLYKSKLEEPEWLKKIFCSLHYRIVLVNERDLIRCDISAYTPVEVEHDNTSCAFLAIPDESVRIGHVALHQRSCVQYFPAVTNNTRIWVKKINTVKYADEVLLTPSKVLSEKEHTFMEQQLKLLLFNNFPLGAPFTLNIGSKVYLPLNSMEISFTVSNYKLCKKSTESTMQDESLVNKMQNLSMTSKNDSFNDSTSSIPSQLLTLDKWECSETSLRDRSLRSLLTESDTSSALLTVDEVQTGEFMDASGLDSSVLTSTPKKFISIEGNLHRSLLTSKIHNKECSISGRNKSKTKGCIQSQQSCDWIRIGKETKFRMQQFCKIGDEFAPEVMRSSHKYCKNTAYISLMKIMQTKLKDIRFKENPLLGGWNGVLVYGPPGTGKTHMVNQAAAELGIHVVTLTLADITRSAAGAEECVYHRFKLARESAPSILFLDEVESLCPAGEQKVHSKRDLTPAIIQGIQTLQAAPQPVLLVAATSLPDGITPKLRCSGRLDKELMVGLPNTYQRQNILHQLLSSHKHKISQEEVAEVARRAYGFSGADLSVLLRCAWLSCVKRFDEESNLFHREKTEDLYLSKEDLVAGVRGIVPTMLRQNYSAVSMVKWSDIWGYQKVKSKLQAMIRLHASNPEKHILKGLLFYGPPGCSKTMFVRALVQETSFSFFPLKCSDLLSKYVGETEKSLSKVFRRAWQAAPSIIFMDEVDSLCGDRGGGGGLVSEFLSLMAQNVTLGNVMVIGATNRPHAIDEAVLRPNCLEHVIHIDLPDFNSRYEIWKGILRDIPLKGQVVIEKLSGATAGYSGAEITAIYQEAAHNAISQLNVQGTQTLSTQYSQESITISEEQLLRVINTVPSRTPSSLLESINHFTCQRQKNI